MTYETQRKGGDMSGARELKPCPWCGHKPRLSLDDYDARCSQKYEIECDNPECTREVDCWSFKALNYDKLVDDWNNRPWEAALEARKRENEALREAEDRKDEALRETRQRLSYDAELFHDQGCCDRESACLDAMRRIEAALSGHTEKGGE